MSITFPTLPGVSSPVIIPGDAEYETARRAWNLALNNHPAAVAYPADAAEVAAIVRGANEAGLTVAVRGGGHNVAPLGDLSASVMIRTDAMSGVEIDTTTRTARVEAGVLWEPVVDAAARHGLYPLHGSSPDVGVVGYSLHGGIGWVARQHGLQSSRIRAADVVTGEGHRVRVQADRESDLFWALRGGGSFGIVTALEFDLLSLTSAYAGWLAWDWTHAERVLARWIEWTQDAPETATTSARILKMPPLPEVPEPLRGRKLVVIDGAVLADTREGSRAIAGLREMAPEIDTFASVAAPALARLHGDPEQPVPVVADHAMLRGLDADAATAFVEAAGPESRSTLLTAELRHLGGALARPAPGGGALEALDGEYALYAGALALDPLGAAVGREDARRLVTAMEDWHGGRRYANFTEEPTNSAEFHSLGIADRLRSVRDAVDPGRTLRVAHDTR